MKEDKNRIICPLCAGEDVIFFTRKNKYNLYKCLSCKFLFVYPHLSNMNELYDKSYFSGAERGFGFVDYDADKKPMIPTFKKYLDLISSHLSSSLSGISGNSSQYKLLDVGAATGFFMRLAEQRGFKSMGVELSDYAGNLGRKNGLDIVTGDLQSANFPENTFDVITMCDVLEHVTSPIEFLLEAKKILKYGGLLVINTPNAQSLIARIFTSHWHLIVPPEHIHYFSPKNLSTFLQKEGFDIISNTTIGKRFTLEYIFKTLYRWQGISLWLKLSNFFSKNQFSNFHIPINLYDNFFIIARKR